MFTFYSFVLFNWKNQDSFSMFVWFVLEVAERRQLDFDGERLNVEANHGHNVLVSQAAYDSDLFARGHVSF